MEKKILTGLTLGELREFVTSLGEPAFRGRQLFDWLYTKEASSFDEMTSLSKMFRERLNEAAAIGAVRLVESQRSARDGTLKLLFELHDGERIESVLIPAQSGFDPGDSPEERSFPASDRLTLCVSTQVGCPLDCAFCATGKMGFFRNLSVGEIVDQLAEAKRVARRRITNLVYMGMGEPLLNYENVMKSIEIITTGMGIAARRITLSTAGWADRIREMADEGRKVKLAISLHSMDENVRKLLMPIAKKFSLPELLDALQYYYRKTKRRVTYEYIPFKDLNDTDEDIRRLIKLSKIVPCKINIVPFHDIGFTRPQGFAASLRPSSQDRMDEFVRRLREAHISVFVRSDAGEDIDAACGQLAILHQTTSRFEYA